MALQPQAALETAVRDLIRSGLGYTADQCERTFDDRPPPSAGTWFVSVWSEGRVLPGGANQRAALDRRWGVNVTVSLRGRYPYDRRVKDRDAVEQRINAIVALIANAAPTNVIGRAADVLAEYEVTGTEDLPRPVRFAQPPYPDGVDGVHEVDGRHWQGTPDASAGLAQTAKFSEARHIQAFGTAV